ncbi:hypothetical protein B0H17DRAFT_1141764 [Mycena rosella]|uniref:Uncharacterized protein n=1 Tax=Mycena rosella TaxID=1033263 RepID=A0AAD7CYX2_MYCRO|nr:hypothetical protein B0H17DRAFT_1141764 [Mycena rosella]
MTLPVVEKALREFLGDKFSVNSLWRMTLDRLIGCEDGDEALNVLTQAQSQVSGSTPALPSPPPQLVSMENDLMNKITILHQRKRITTSGMPTIDDLVDPADEHDVGQSEFDFQTDEQIVDAVRHEEAIARGDVMDVDDSDNEGEEETPDLSTAEILELCQKLEKACLMKGEPDQSMALTGHLRQFHANIRREEFLGAKQITLAEAWGRKAN